MQGNAELHFHWVEFITTLIIKALITEPDYILLCPLENKEFLSM